MDKLLQIQDQIAEEKLEESWREVEDYFDVRFDDEDDDFDLLLRIECKMKRERQVEEETSEKKILDEGGYSSMERSEATERPNNGGIPSPGNREKRVL